MEQRNWGLAPPPDLSWDSSKLLLLGGWELLVEVNFIPWNAHPSSGGAEKALDVGAGIWKLLQFHSNRAGGEDGVRHPQYLL